MKQLKLAVLYLALALGANAAVAAETAELEALRAGDMKKLAFHETPKPASELDFEDAEGGVHNLSEYRGKYVLLNFWATWCAPCREEMPGLAALQDDLGGEDFAVVPLATGRNSVTGIRKFFDEIEVKNLPILLDPKQALAREMAVLGLPITVILDPEGQEIARLQGDADWTSESARSILTELLATPGN